jgi:hypothetical protein
MLSKNKIINYIEVRHLSDGGYYFAGIEPSSGADTFFAVKILSMLGTKPKDPESIKKFLEENVALTDIHGLYFTLETLVGLGYDIGRYRHYTGILDREKNKDGGFGITGEKYVEVTSDLATTYEAIVVAKYLDYQLNKESLKTFILSFQNMDGGFGSGRHSLLSTTYYAVSCLDRLNLLSNIEKDKVIRYLRGVEVKMKHYFLEDLFYLMMSLFVFGQRVSNTQKAFEFVYNCWRSDNGGFKRSPIIGISTFEDTFYAVTILKKLEQNGVKVFSD